MEDKNTMIKKNDCSNFTILKSIKQFDSISNLQKVIISCLLLGFLFFMFTPFTTFKHLLPLDETKQNIYTDCLTNYQKQIEMHWILLAVIFLGLCTIFMYYSLNALNHIRLKQKFQNKLIHNDFLLYYQPIVSPEQNKVVACEALLRMKDKDRILSPFHFLDTMDKLDMMEDITIWILKRIIEDYQEIRTSIANLDEDFYISLNISFKELESPLFIERMKNVLSGVDLTKIKLCFEIVEKYKLHDKKPINLILQELKLLGIKIAIDDFGVEYANLDMLGKIDYDIIKLDKQFIDNIQNSFIHQESILFITKIIKYYKKILVIEGLEDYSQLKVLQKLSSEIIYIQGYLYSPPISLEELKQFKISL